MRWKGSRRSSNVTDRRRGGTVAVGGGGGGILMVVLYLVLGGDPGDLAQNGGSPASGRTSSACGLGSSAMGPFYCPSDATIYLDLTFFDDLTRLGAPGDFAAAYVTGHEVGHHVQHLLGTADQVRQRQARASEVEANALSVSLELQADCYAGVWANRAERDRRWLEPGDVDEGLAAAAAIGDDRMQRRAGREVVPETFTHGSASERQRALRLGLESGDPEACASVGG